MAPTLLRSQQDVYGASVGANRLAGALSALSEPPLRQSFLAGGVLLLAWLAVGVTVPKAHWRIPAFLLAVIVWLFACLFLDDWFYGGNYALPRYRAIVDLLIRLQFVGAACLSIVAVRRSRRHGRAVSVLAIASMAASSFFLARLVRVSVTDLRLTHQTAIYHAATSNKYQHGLSEALARLAVEPKPSVAVIATNGGDYEPAYAVLNELARRSHDPLREYLIVANSSEKADPLLAAIARVSGRGARDWHTRPVSELRGTGAAVCIFLNEHPRPIDGCQHGSGIRVVAQGI